MPPPAELPILLEYPGTRSASTGRPDAKAEQGNRSSCPRQGQPEDGGGSQQLDHPVLPQRLLQQHQQKQAAFSATKK